MKTNLLKTSSIIALTAFLGFQLPATDLGRLIEDGLGITPAAAKTVLPAEVDADHVDAPDGDDDDDEEEHEHDEDGEEHEHDEDGEEHEHDEDEEKDEHEHDEDGEEHEHDEDDD